MQEGEHRIREQKDRDLQAAEYESARLLAKHSQLWGFGAIGREKRPLKQWSNKVTGNFEKSTKLNNPP
ncbi:hypothetical protein DL767_011391 [Monosporascus sp. MG133]|nr:hypothetical protein DL767_011391 [Monosporascus sp. MG133]